MIVSTRGLLRAVAATSALCLLGFGLGTGAAAARTDQSSLPALAGPGVAAPAAATGWTAGGLITGVGAPRTAAMAPNGFAHVGGCVFYASSTYAGGYCPSGAVGSGGPRPPSLRAWLDGREFTACRFFEFPPAWS